MTLRTAYLLGARAALTKYAGSPMGADYGVRPRGPEVSHGTLLQPYADNGAPTQRPVPVDRVWELFGKNREGPGTASGEYGHETIG